MKTLHNFLFFETSTNNYAKTVLSQKHLKTLSYLEKHSDPGYFEELKLHWKRIIFVGQCNSIHISWELEAYSYVAHTTSSWTVYNPLTFWLSVKLIKQYKDRVVLSMKYEFLILWKHLTYFLFRSDYRMSFFNGLKSFTLFASHFKIVKCFPNKICITLNQASSSRDQASVVSP